jgi:UDP-glucose 4-epimerase
MNKMKVLVTGGAGFIGSHIVDLFIKKGYDVVVVDNLSTGKKQNLNPKSKFYDIDITTENLTEIFEKELPDFVSHHAAQINVRNSVKNPAYDSKINILGTINLLELCKRFKVKKVVYASTGGALYGEPKYLPCDEKHPIQPISPYGVSKYSAELFLNYYYQVFGLKYCALRYGNVYGPRQDPKGEAGVVAIFSQQMLNNEQCMINGDGNQTRDFVFVKDVAKANLLALKADCDQCAVNIGTGKEFSVNELFRKMKTIFKSNLEPTNGPAIPGEVEKIFLDIKLAKKVLGWEPIYGIEEGLKETLEWYK